MYHLAEGLTDATWPQAAVLIITMLVPVIMAVVQYLEKRLAQRQRDAIIKGVESANHAETKRLVKVHAHEDGIGPSLQTVVKEVTNGVEKTPPKKPKWPPVALWLMFIPFLFMGCTHNLQRPYVESMEKTRKAVEYDVRRGAYKADAATALMLRDWKTANQNAFLALVAQEKKKREKKE